MTSRGAVPAAALGTFTIALAFRGWGISRPGIQIFDEVYYANDALDLILRGAERSFAAHPPLGKELIGVGIALFGFTPLGWRSPALVAGAITAMLVYLCAFRLTGRAVYALAAPAFLLLDGISFTTARFALLDGFVALFTTLALTILVLDPFSRRPVFAAACLGAALGCAIAVKWSALPLLPLAAVAAPGSRYVRPALRVVRGAVVVFCAGLVYVASYSPWIASGSRFGDCPTARCERGVLGRVEELPSIQRRMYDYNLELVRRNPSLAPAWYWAIQTHPTVLARESCVGRVDTLCSGRTRETHTIEAVGNRVLWPSALAVLLVSVSLIVVRRRPPGDLGLPVLWVVLLWGPWLAWTSTYTFYAAPIVPALAVVAVAGLTRLAGPRRASVLVGLLLTSALIDFGLSWSVLH